VRAVQDKHGGPLEMRVSILSEDGKLVKHHPYWAWYHVAHFIERGAVVLGCAAPAGILATAAENPGGSVVVVILNTGADAKMSISISGQWVQVEVAHYGLQTVVLR
jgi:hypothetical protein